MPGPLVTVCNEVSQGLATTPNEGQLLLRSPCGSGLWSPAITLLSFPTAWFVQVLGRFLLDAIVVSSVSFLSVSKIPKASPYKTLQVVGCKEKGVADMFTWVSKSSSNLQLCTGVIPRSREGAGPAACSCTSEGQHGSQCFVLNMYIYKPQSPHINLTTPSSFKDTFNWTVNIQLAQAERSMIGAR